MLDKMNNESFQVTGDHLSKAEKLKLMYAAIEDFEDYLGQTVQRCFSLNLLCLLFGITPTDRHNILQAFKKLAVNHKTDLSDLPKYQRAISSPGTKFLDSQEITIQFITAAANSSLPELKGLADNLLKHTKLNLQ
ncbi:hypothetical protein [Lentilactobacillus farraginis]|nr:hypothetical protein [Lentilactobacillus farraginis]KRM03772.1 hypothetical protein FD41_GL001017 [Lentilactobacillus farraginis DSM 18382 = JCM 14108]